MLYTEWNLEDAIAVAKEEAREEGLEEGFKEGIEKGLERGLEKGLEEGMQKSQFEIAKNLLADGCTPDYIQKITKLSLEEIKKL